MPTSHSFGPKLDRRGFLSMAAIGGLALGTAGVLSSCTSPASTGTGTGGGGSVALPTYVPIKTVKPDLAGTADGVLDAYFTYPDKLVKTVHKAPGSGKPLEALVITYATIPTTSTYTAAVAKAINAPVKLNLVPEADYAQRFATTTAGGSLPDWILIPFADNLPSVGAFLNAKCVDLSEHLSGDAVKKYPNLAAVSTPAWNNARVNGRIYGVPIPRDIFGRAPFYRKDIVDKRGVPLPTNAKEFTSFCKEFTNPKAGEYAITGFNAGGISPLVLILFSSMFNVPNYWKEENGKFTYYIETEEFKESVAYTKSLWDAGVFHPTAASASTAQASNLFMSGKCILTENGNAGWAGNQQIGVAANPDFLIGAIPPFGAKGGPGAWWYRPGAFGYTVVTNHAKSRVEEVLGIMNYFAAPFGSEEFNLLNFGVKGVDYTDSPTGPLLTAQGKNDITTSYNYIAAPNPVNVAPEFVDQVVKPRHAWQSKVVQHGQKDPSVGLYSETASRKLGPLLTSINDTITSVVVGRKPLSGLSATVDAWNAGGGKQITAEYEKAFKKANA